MMVQLSSDEAWAVAEARDLLARYLPADADRSGFEDLVMERLDAIVSEIRQPLVPPGSEAFMADFLADLVDQPTLPGLAWSNDDYSGSVERHLKFGVMPYDFEAVILGSSNGTGFQLYCYPNPDLDTRWIEEFFEAADVDAAIVEAVRQIQEWLPGIQDAPDFPPVAA